MKRSIICVFLAFAASMSACGLLDPQPDPSRFFVLASLHDLASTVEPCPLPAGASVGLGPVNISDYLDEPSLLTRTSPTELTRSGVDRWAEPLISMLPRVLSEDFAQLLGVPSVVEHPWYAPDRPAWQIEIDIVRFEPDAQGNVTLIAQWRVHEIAVEGSPSAQSSMKDQSRSVAKESRITHQAAGKDPAQRVQAQSAALGELAAEIAHALCELAGSKPSAAGR